MDPLNQPNLNPADYLNTISAAPKQSMFSSKYALIGIILLIIVVVTVGFLVVTSSFGGGNAKIVNVSARLETLETISSDEQTNLKSTQLRASNKNLNTYLNGVNKNIKNIAPESANLTKLPKTILDQEVEFSDQLLAAFTDAKLNGYFDAVYIQEMTLVLGLLIVDLQIIEKQYPAGEFKTFIGEVITNLQTTAESIKTTKLSS